jgi:hypothetical protein
MDNQPSMRVFDCGADLLEQFQPFGNGKVAPVTEFGDGTASNIFHDDELPAIFGDATIKQPRDIWVIEFGQNPAFLFEAPGGFLCRAAGSSSSTASNRSLALRH